MHLPTITLDTVWHIGTLEPNDKGSCSLEGAGLSVSVHPDAWEQIARLGGNPWWELEQPDAVFLDAHAMRADDRDHVMSWGTANGLCVPVTGYQVTWWDDEEKCERSFVIAEHDEACAEAAEYDTTPVAVPASAATTVLQTRSAWGSRIDLVCVDDLVLALYAEHMTCIDGVWWDDDLDPCALSAPRGVIGAATLASWTATRIQ